MCARGPAIPFFNEKLRAENVASLGNADYVSIVEDAPPGACIKMLRPDIFARGQDYDERDQDVVKKIEQEEESLEIAGCKIHYTPGKVYSSTNIINQFLDVYPEEVKRYLKNFRNKYTPQDIIRAIEGLKKMRVLIIGDGIIDEYHYCSTLGKSAKAPLVVNRYLSHEVFAGGAFAVANHVAGICGEVQLVTLLGEINSREEFILQKLKPNVKTKFFYREEGPTVIKRRYIDRYLNQKLFEINYLKNEYINEKCESAVVEYLKKQTGKYDLILVPDFGHGFITDKIIKMIKQVSGKVAVNTQTNAANAGYNMITKYQNPNCVCLDEVEARWATQERFSDIEMVIRRLSKALKTNYLIITMGKSGSIGIDKKGEINRSPVFSTKVTDTVGAGDAVFSFVAPCCIKRMPLDLITFIGNAVGAIAVQIVCNRESVEPKKLFEFTCTLLH